MNRLIVIGTRKSKLALWQAQWVKTQLASVGIASKLVPVSTQGDRILDVSISEIGSKGVFTKELENKLQNGEIDIAVHSAKDMPRYCLIHLRLSLSVLGLVPMMF